MRNDLQSSTCWKRTLRKILEKKRWKVKVSLKIVSSLLEVLFVVDRETLDLCFRRFSSSENRFDNQNLWEFRWARKTAENVFEWRPTTKNDRSKDDWLSGRIPFRMKNKWISRQASVIVVLYSVAIDDVRTLDDAFDRKCVFDHDELFAGIFRVYEPGHIFTPRKLIEIWNDDHSRG